LTHASVQFPNLSAGIRYFSRFTLFLYIWTISPSTENISALSGLLAFDLSAACAIRNARYEFTELNVKCVCPCVTSITSFQWKWQKRLYQTKRVA